MVVGQEIMSYVPCLVENALKQRDVVSKAEDLNVSVIVPTMGDSVSEELNGSKFKTWESCEKRRVDSAN